MKKRLIVTYLIDLLKLGAGETYIKAPTIYLSHVFGLSQQSTSRVINKLFDLGYIYKANRNGVIWVKLSDKALEELNQYFNYIDGAKKYPGKFVFEGRVISGLGEGAYYMTRPGYKKQFLKYLGYIPYPGTLNIKLTNPYMIHQNEILRLTRGIKISGFKDRRRTFGDVYIYPAKIMDQIDGAVIYAKRSIYGPDIIEVISKHYLRGLLKLKDGDKIKVVVNLLLNK